jgi:SAM-dependent methyltransferase
MGVEAKTKSSARCFPACSLYRYSLGRICEWMTDPSAKQFSLPVRALPGTHERVVQTALRYVPVGSTALDLGAGSGGLTERLLAANFRVTAADVGSAFELPTDFVSLDCNDPAFDRVVALQFDLIAAVEVIEHLENPTAFLRSISRLLKPNGVAILTTPNVDNVPARLKFLLRGELRAMDKFAPEHVTPIHLDLFVRKIVPVSGLVLAEHFVYPENQFPLTARSWMTPIFRLLMPLMNGPALSGDCHFFVLKKAANPPANSTRN